MAWIAPRGIVAAAISSLFALKLNNYGHEDAAILVPLTFTVIIFTVLLQSLTAVPLAILLKVTLPKADGFLIIGSNRLSRAIAKKLMVLNVKVLIADTSIERIVKAEELNIPSYNGDPFSGHMEYNLELAGLGKLLALSAYESENIAATLHYRQEFGRNNIYSILSNVSYNSEKNISTKNNILKSRGKNLFNENVNYQTLAQMLARGATLKLIPIREKFDPKDFHNICGKEAVPLFGIDLNNQAHCFSADVSLQINGGWQILYLGY